MYRRPKFMEMLLEIRREMALEADYDVDLFVARARESQAPMNGKPFSESQTVFEASNIDRDILPVNKSGREIRKG